MNASTLRISWWMLGGVWLLAVALVAALAWTPLIGSPIPFGGLRSVAAVPFAWVIVMAYLFTAIWLSVPAWHGKDRLLVALGVILASALWCLLLSMPLAASWLVAGQAVHHALRRSPPAAGPDAVRRKLELARAHIDLGNRVGAEATLREITLEGSELQRREAASLLARLER